MVSWLLRPLIRCYNPAKLPDKLQLICFLNSTNRIAAELLPKLHSSHQTERCDSPNLLVDLRPAPVFEEYFSSHPLSDRRHCDSVCYVKRSTDSKDSAVAKRLQTHVAWSRMILPPQKSEQVYLWHGQTVLTAVMALRAKSLSAYHLLHPATRKGHWGRPGLHSGSPAYSFHIREIIRKRRGKRERDYARWAHLTGKKP